MVPYMIPLSTFHDIGRFATLGIQTLMTATDSQHRREHPAGGDAPGKPTSKPIRDRAVHAAIHAAWIHLHERPDGWHDERPEYGIHPIHADAHVSVRDAVPEYVYALAARPIF